MKSRLILRIHCCHYNNYHRHLFCYLFLSFAVSLYLCLRPEQVLFSYDWQNSDLISKNKAYVKYEYIYIHIRHMWNEYIYIYIYTMHFAE